MPRLAPSDSERPPKTGELAVEHPEVDVVVVCAPNMLHEPLATAAAEAGKHVFCEKPVGGTPSQTARIAHACRRAGIVTGVGYNYRFAPLVLYAQELIAKGELGQISNYRGRFFSMYGSDPMGLLSWRFLIDQAGHGATTDIMSHAVDLALMLNGPIDRVVGIGETFITERPLPSGAGTPLRPRQPRRPNRRGHQRGLLRGTGGVRQRQPRRFRIKQGHRRPPEPNGL